MYQKKFQYYKKTAEGKLQLVDTCKFDLSKDIKGRVNISMMIILQNAQGIVTSMATTSSNRVMSTRDGQSVVELSLKDLEEPSKSMCLVSFDID